MVSNIQLTELVAILLNNYKMYFNWCKIMERLEDNIKTKYNNTTRNVFRRII
jgi:hypothetical protein